MRKQNYKVCSNMICPILYIRLKRKMKEGTFVPTYTINLSQIQITIFQFISLNFQYHFFAFVEFKKNRQKKKPPLLHTYVQFCVYISNLLCLNYNLFLDMHARGKRVLKKHYILSFLWCFSIQLRLKTTSKPIKMCIVRLKSKEQLNKRIYYILQIFWFILLYLKIPF